MCNSKQDNLPYLLLFDLLLLFSLLSLTFFSRRLPLSLKLFVTQPLLSLPLPPFCLLLLFWTIWTTNTNKIHPKLWWWSLTHLRRWILPAVSLFLVVQTPLFVSFLQPFVDPEIAERFVTHKNIEPKFGVPRKPKHVVGKMALRHRIVLEVYLFLWVHPLDHPVFFLLLNIQFGYPLSLHLLGSLLILIKHNTGTLRKH